MATNVPTGKAAEHFAHQFYAALVERANLEKVEGYSDATVKELAEIDGKEVLVYRGKITDLFRELALSQIYYTKIRKIFQQYNCVTYLQRGTRAYDTVLVLNHPPPPIGSVDFTLEGLTDDGEPATLEEVARRLTALEQWRETATGGLNLGDTLRNFELRLARLEGANGSENPQA